MFGLASEVVQFLLEQLPGIENCRHYRCRYQRTLVKVPPRPDPEPEFVPVIISFAVLLSSKLVNVVALYPP